MGNLVPVGDRLSDQVVEVFPLLLVVVDDLGEAVAKVVTVKGQKARGEDPRVRSLEPEVAITVFDAL